jgi:hypothetical protein
LAQPERARRWECAEIGRRPRRRRSPGGTVRLTEEERPRRPGEGARLGRGGGSGGARAGADAAPGPADGEGRRAGRAAVRDGAGCRCSGKVNPPTGNAHRMHKPCTSHMHRKRVGFQGLTGRWPDAAARGRRLQRVTRRKPRPRPRDDPDRVIRDCAGGSSGRWRNWRPTLARRGRSGSSGRAG